jgi:hypothetical protein
LTGNYTHELCAIGGTVQIYLDIKIGGKFIIAIIDSGAIGNFISDRTVSYLKLKTGVKR